MSTLGIVLIPSFNAGTKEAVLGQAARLSLLLDDLSSKQALYDLQRQPVSSDPHGQLLQNLHWLAQHRIEEVQSEIERLSKRYELSDSELKETIEQLVNEQMGHLQQGGQEAGSSAPEVHVGVTGSDPWDNMLDWMRNHGGTVSRTSMTLSRLAYQATAVHQTPRTLVPLVIKVITQSAALMSWMAFGALCQS